MELKWPWLAVGLVLVTIALLAVWFRRPRRPGGGLLVAHTSRLKQVARYRALTRRQLVVTALRVAGALVLAAGAVLLAARPVTVVIEEPDRSARDIQLCLDVSPSMYEWDRQIIGEFRALVDGLAGERIGLTVWNATGVTVFPLTDDYEFIDDRLDEAERAFDGEGYGFFVGTLPLLRIGDQLVPDPKRASQIGDGLVSCLQRFDDLADSRGRAVVIASDNDPAGPPLFTLQQAVDEALRDGVAVYGIGPPDLASKPGDAETFREAVNRTGGTLSLLGQDRGVDDVVRGIQRLERARLEQTPKATEVDDPERAFWLAVAGLTGLIAAAFLRRRS